MTNSTEKQQLMDLVKSMSSENIDKVKIFVSGLEAGKKIDQPAPPDKSA